MVLIILPNVKSGGITPMKSDLNETEKLMGDCSPTPCSASSFEDKLDVFLAETRAINSELRASLERLHILANTKTTA
jgi:hypothetical protein